MELRTKAAVEVFAVAVTNKYRTGWDMKTHKYRSFAKHATMTHANTSDYVSDMATINNALEETEALTLDYTIVDAILIGCGLFGRPWIFAELKKQLFGMQPTSKITNHYKKSMAISHDEENQILRISSTDHLVVSTNNRRCFVCKVINWYLLHMSTQAYVKQNILSCKTPGDQLLLFKDALLVGIGAKLAASQILK